MDLKLALEIAGIVFAAGAIYGELKGIRADIARLEKKVEKHNNFDRRIIRLETIAELKGDENAKV